MGNFYFAGVISRIILSWGKMKNKLLSVAFEPRPNTIIRDIDNENDSAVVINNKKKYPFELLNGLDVLIETEKFNFSFTIPEGYVWNGADIPKTLFLFGQSKDNNYLHASMVHDYMLEFKEDIYNDILNRSISIKEYRRLTSLIFRQILKDEKTNVIKANVMAWCVDVFQGTFNKKQWECLK